MVRVPAFKLILEPIDAAARNLEPFLAPQELIGKRHQLGGEPTFIREPEWPLCAACHEPMSFYGQLDSINDEYGLADGGMIYVFVCYNDFEVKAVFQTF